MGNYKSIIEKYNVSGINSTELLHSFECFHHIFDNVEKNNPKLFWESMRKFHEHIKGPHFDEEYAKYQVANMYHTDKNGNVCKKEFYNISDAKTIYDKYVRNINSENTVWDVYIALNAQYHDYIKLYKDWFTDITKEELDDKIITSCINFWFKDEDAGVGKVWNYFKNIG